MKRQIRKNVAQLNYVIRSLILGEPVNYDYYMEFIQKYRLDPQAVFTTIVVQIDGRYDPANLSLKATSDALFMHKHTQYQLDRIWKNSGYNPRAFQDAVILYLGVKLLL